MYLKGVGWANQLLLIVEIFGTLSSTPCLRLASAFCHRAVHSQRLAQPVSRGSEQPNRRAAVRCTLRASLEAGGAAVSAILIIGASAKCYDVASALWTIALLNGAEAKDSGWTYKH